MRYSRRYAVALTLSLALVPLIGCGPRRLRSDFTNFEQAFATTSNRETLLNLARLEQRDPTYFFKLGQITSTYRMQATLSGSGNYVIQGTGSGGNAIGGGAPGLLYENDPTFTFIPVNDETNAQLLLKPMPAETFYNLYQQGWRLDQLVRLMVDRIEYTLPVGKGCVVRTLHNAPPLVYGNDTTYARDQEALHQYVTFLRVSALMYALQKHGHLLLKGQTAFKPYDPKSYVIDNSPTAAAKDKAAPPEGGGEQQQKPPASSLPAAKDLLDASAKNASWELNKDGNWTLGQIVVSPVFYLNPLLEPDKDGHRPPDLGAIQSEINSDPSFSELSRGGGSLGTVLYLLGNGFSIEGMPDAQAESPDPCKASPHLYLRTLLGLMAAAAQEQKPFEQLVANDPDITRTPDDPATAETLKFSAAVPAVERLPLLRIQRATQPAIKEGPPMIQLNYLGTHYEIADAINDSLPEDSYWNHDVFRLIGMLTSQVTVDITKFAQQILQLHQ